MELAILLFVACYVAGNDASGVTREINLKYVFVAFVGDCNKL